MSENDPRRAHLTYILNILTINPSLRCKIRAGKKQCEHGCRSHPIVVCGPYHPWETDWIA